MARLGDRASQTSFKDITTYNNFYEFGTGKGDPAANAHTLKTIAVVRAGDRRGRQAGHATRSRTSCSRTRSRSASTGSAASRRGRWSIPWVGFPLGDLLKRFEPTSNAKYVQFFTLADKKQMPEVRYPVLQWPYREGLTIAEAMHPLTLATVGLYGKVLPNQNGAPLRIVIPWKYGFKRHQVDRPHSLHGPPAADELEHGAAARVRLLLERESERGPPALEPSDGAPARRRSFLGADSDTRCSTATATKSRSCTQGLDLIQNY